MPCLVTDQHKIEQIITAVVLLVSIYIYKISDNRRQLMPVEIKLKLKNVDKQIQSNNYITLYPAQIPMY